jgi:hypothetical protein
VTEFPGLVETSTNLAIVRTGIVAVSLSSEVPLIQQKKIWLNQRGFEMAGATIKFEILSGWSPI